MARVKGVPNRPKLVVLTEKVEKAQARVEAANKALEEAETALAEYQEREKATAGDRIKNLEAELEALRRLA